MKKNLLILCVISGLALSANASTDSTESKAIYTQKCVDRWAADPTMPKDAAERYCSCITDRVFNNLTDEEIEQTENLHSMSPALASKYKNAIQGCSAQYNPDEE